MKYRVILKPHLAAGAITCWKGFVKFKKGLE